jgi:hypothetical protein
MLNETNILHTQEDLTYCDLEIDLCERLKDNATPEATL